MIASLTSKHAAFIRFVSQVAYLFAKTVVVLSCCKNGRISIRSNCFNVSSSHVLTSAVLAEPRIFTSGGEVPYTGGRDPFITEGV